jgi:hypothetical protein
MAGPNDIRDALMAGMSQPEDDAADPKAGDLRCPTCGASCQKIEAAAQGGAAPPSGGLGLR